jgi:hypothetical protein
MAPTRDRLPGSNISPSTCHAMAVGTGSKPRLYAQRSSMRRALQQSLGSLVDVGDTDAALGGSKGHNTLGHSSATSSTASSTTPKLGPQAPTQENGTVLAGKEKLSESRDNLSSSSFADISVRKLTPQRSSLRRAIRESQQVGIQNTDGDGNTNQDFAGENATFSLDKSTNSRCGSSLNSKADNLVSLKTPPPELNSDGSSNPLLASWVDLPSQPRSPPGTPISPVSDILHSNKIYFHPRATIKVRKATRVRPHITKAPNTRRLLRSSTPASHSKWTPEPGCGSVLPDDDVQRDISALTAARKNPPHNAKHQNSHLDSETQAGRRGWHKVHQIVNDAPSGLYLVEWEGRDPRTGVMVSPIDCKSF